MSFDSSRFTFDPAKNYFGVVMQQGRVQLDSDWNEWQAELAHRIQAGTLDILGMAGVSSITPGAFRITPSVDTSTTPAVPHVTIGVGRMYVDGILAENHGTGQASIDYIDYTVQPYYPGAIAISGNGPFLFYLDVWQREVTYLQDPDLVDKAVGVDTTGRYQTVWQVKYVDLTAVADQSCSNPSIDPATLFPSSVSQLTTGIVAASSVPPGPCSLSPTAGYSGLENQLYRVEIHQSGSASPSPAGTAAATRTATFKFSNNDASIFTPVTAISGATLTVRSFGKDNQALGLRPGDWIEITNDLLELNGEAGELHLIVAVDFTANKITLDSAPGIPLAPLGQPDTLRTRVTRWDQAGVVYESDGTTVWVDLNASGGAGIPVPPSGTTLILENGITAQFDLASPAGSFQTGDFWNFAARTADASVEILTQAAPFASITTIAVWVLVDFRPSKPTVTDCRRLFPALANLAIHVLDVRMGNTSLKNDGIFTFDNLRSGINVVCDIPVDPAIVSQPQNPNSPICFLTIDVPASATLGAGFTPLVVQANVSVSLTNNTINWIPGAGYVDPPAGSAPAQPFLARLTLKGNAIRAADNPNVLFNGAAEVVTNTPTGLRLPSGDGRRFADFEMWFWLSPQPVVSLSPGNLVFPDQLVGTTSTEMSVTLTNNSPNQIVISSITVTQDATDFALVNPQTPAAALTVPAAGTYQINVTFTPAGTGTRTGSISVNESVDSTPLLVALTGNGITRQMTVSPPSPPLYILGFPTNQPVGQTSAPLTVTLTGAGTSPVVSVFSIVLDDPNFKLQSPSSGSSTSLATGQTFNILVQFNPITTTPTPLTGNFGNHSQRHKPPESSPPFCCRAPACKSSPPPATTTAPDLTGFTLAQVNTALLKAKLLLGTVKQPINSTGKLTLVLQSRRDPLVQIRPWLWKLRSI